MALLEEAHRSGSVTPPAGSVPRSVRRDMEAIAHEYGLTVPVPSLARGLGLWSALVGAVSFEVFDQYGPDTFSDAGAFFDLHLEALITSVGF
jgi:hypothetical protein